MFPAKKARRLKTAGFFLGGGFFDVASTLDGFLGQEISEQACHATDEFLGTCHSNRVSIDYEDLRESWSDEFQALARGVSDFDLATDSLDDTIFVPGPLGVDDGFAIMFNRLSDVRGIGGTNASKILALHNSAGLAMWDIRNIRSLWGIQGHSDAFSGYQKVAQETIVGWVYEAQCRLGL